jgi:hypothetical protein
MLTLDDSNRLKDAGYTDWEIGQFSEGRTPDGKDQPPINLNDIPWQKAMTSRRKWKDQLISDGWSEQQFVENIYSQYNKDIGTSPWDFLKAEYKPPQKVNFRSTIEATARVRNFKTGIRRELRQTKRKIAYDITGEEATKDKEFYEQGLGETIRRIRNQ